MLRMLRACLAFSHGQQANSTVFDARSGLWQLPMRRLRSGQRRGGGRGEPAEAARKLSEVKEQARTLKGQAEALRKRIDLMMGVR